MHTSLAVSLFMLEAEVTVLPPLQEGKRDHLWSSFEDTHAGTAFFVQLARGMGWTLILHCPPMHCLRNARAPVWAQLCSTQKKAKTAGSRRCLDQCPWPPIFAQPLIQCCPLHTPSLVTWSLESGSGYTEVNKQSQLRSVNVLMEEVVCDVNTMIQVQGLSQ